MVVDQIEARGVRDQRVRSIMKVVPRHLFVPEVDRSRAYEDRALAIGRGATISQPVIVAQMTESLELTGTERVLEVGTGSGYQTALLSELAGEVWTIEIDEELAHQAEERLASLGYRDRLHFRVGSGESGWPEAAPFERILLSAAPERMPRALLDQLADGGRLVGPVGPTARQRLKLVERQGSRFEETDLGPVRFVRLRTTSQDPFSPAG